MAKLITGPEIFELVAIVMILSNVPQSATTLVHKRLTRGKSLTTAEKKTIKYRENAAEDIFTSVAKVVAPCRRDCGTQEA